MLDYPPRRAARTGRPGKRDRRPSALCSANAINPEIDPGSSIGCCLSRLLRFPRVNADTSPFRWVGRSHHLPNHIADNFELSIVRLLQSLELAGQFGMRGKHLPKA